MSKTFWAVMTGALLVIILYAVAIVKVQADTMGFYEDAFITHGATDWKIEDHKCGPLHENNDALNELCHIGVAETTHAVVRNLGFSEYEAHIAALLLLYGWESTNKNPDWAEVFTAPIKLHPNVKISVNWKLTSGYIEYSKDLNIF